MAVWDGGGCVERAPFLSMSASRSRRPPRERGEPAAPKSQQPWEAAEVAQLEQLYQEHLPGIAAEWISVAEQLGTGRPWASVQQKVTSSGWRQQTQRLVDQTFDLSNRDQRRCALSIMKGAALVLQKDKYLLALDWVDSQVQELRFVCGHSGARPQIGVTRLNVLCRNIAGTVAATHCEAERLAVGKVLPTLWCTWPFRD